jgi:hypothetical protein
MLKAATRPFRAPAGRKLCNQVIAALTDFRLYDRHDA